MGAAAPRHRPQARHRVAAVRLQQFAMTELIVIQRIEAAHVLDMAE